MLHIVRSSQGCSCTAGEIQHRSEEELLASFVLAYHLSAGGPWLQSPQDWAEAQTQSACSDLEAAWRAGRLRPQTVRHLIHIKSAFRAIAQNPECCSVLGRQAAAMYTGHFDESLVLPLENLPAQLPASPRKRGVAPSRAQRQPPPARLGKKKKRRQAATSSSLIGVDASQRDLVGPSAVHASAQQAQPAHQDSGPTHMGSSAGGQQPSCGPDTDSMCQPPSGKLSRLNRPTSPGKLCSSELKNTQPYGAYHQSVALPWQSNRLPVASANPWGASRTA